MDRKTLGAVLIAALVLAACSSKPQVIVGSKNFTEEVILGEIAAQQLERRMDIRVKRQLNLGGTLLAHQALINGQIDLYPEYTGTAFTSMLRHFGVTDPATVLEQVRAEYSTALHLKWMEPLGFDDGFAMAIPGALAREKHFETLSDAEASQRIWNLGSGYEFLERPDGFSALQRQYSKMQWKGSPRTMDLGLLYRALAQKQVDMVAGNTTDAALAGADIKVLRDDRNAFPPYQASIVVRYDSLERVPGLEKALAELSGKISSTVMQKMNADVEIKHRPVAEVAAEFLRTIR